MVESQAGESPAFAAIVPAEDGNVIVSWVRDISTFFSPRHVRANKFSPSGAPVWSGPVYVFDAVSVPIAHTPRLVGNGAGGAVIYWQYSGVSFDCYVQHLDAVGLELFSHNGQTVATSTARHHLDPSLSYISETGESIVFWNERNLNQTQWGIYAQKLSATGARMWGDNGRELLPVNTVYKSFPRSAPCSDGAMVFLNDEPTGLFDEDRVISMRLDGEGNQVWPGGIIEVSSLLSEKAHLPLTSDDSGVVELIWEDRRSGNRDIYGQNVNPDGTLGPAISAVGPACVNLVGIPRLLPSHPNPFNPRTSVVCAIDRPRQVRISVCDLTGRRLVVMADRMFEAGIHTFSWNGRDTADRAVAAGTYLVQLESENLVASRKILMVR